MIRVVCGCGRVFKAEARHTGKPTRCPACGAGLIIGQTPTSGSGEAELSEVPSWWYPNDSPEANGAEVAPPGGNDNPEAVRTAVLEPGIVLQNGDAMGLRGDAHRTPAAPADTARPSWSRPTAIAVPAVLALGALCWYGLVVATPDITPAQRPPVAKGTTEDGRVPAPAVPEEVRPGRPARRLRLLVPAYIYPTGDGRAQWRRLFDAGAKVDLVAVVNIDSGPGAERNPDYAAVIAEAADRGVKLIGYINTEYAARPASQVRADVDTWVRLYPRIAGFFLDQQPVDAGHPGYIADISGYARGKLRGAIVITDPGAPCDESYLTRRASDVVCVFSHFEGFTPFELPAHLKGYDPSHFAALLYQVGDAEAMRSALKEAIIKRLGYIYVTDGKGPNPWSRLPAYWEEEVEVMSRLQ